MAIHVLSIGKHISLEQAHSSTERPLEHYRALSSGIVTQRLLHEIPNEDHHLLVAQGITVSPLSSLNPDTDYSFPQQAIRGYRRRTHNLNKGAIQYVLYCSQRPLSKRTEFHSRVGFGNDGV